MADSPGAAEAALPECARADGRAQRQNQQRLRQPYRAPRHRSGRLRRQNLHAPQPTPPAPVHSREGGHAGVEGEAHSQRGTPAMPYLGQQQLMHRSHLALNMDAVSTSNTA